jgi:mRNA interferase MazF
MTLKSKVHHRNHQPPLVSEGEIWWITMGSNIGSEINGKSAAYSRPGIIFKKLSQYTFCIIPTSTRMHQGTWFVPFTHNGEPRNACLHQVRVIDYRRLLSRLGKLSHIDHENIKKQFVKLYT